MSWIFRGGGGTGEMEEVEEVEEVKEVEEVESHLVCNDTSSRVPVAHGRGAWVPRYKHVFRNQASTGGFAWTYAHCFCINFVKLLIWRQNVKDVKA